MFDQSEKLQTTGGKKLWLLEVRDLAYWREETRATGEKTRVTGGKRLGLLERRDSGYWRKRLGLLERRD